MKRIWFGLLFKSTVKTLDDGVSYRYWAWRRWTPIYKAIRWAAWQTGRAYRAWVGLGVNG